MKQKEFPKALPFCRTHRCARLRCSEALVVLAPEAQVPGGTSCFASASGAECACGSPRLGSNRGLISYPPAQTPGSVAGFRVGALSEFPIGRNQADHVREPSHEAWDGPTAMVPCYVRRNGQPSLSGVRGELRPSRMPGPLVPGIPGSSCAPATAGLLRRWVARVGAATSRPLRIPVADPGATSSGSRVARLPTLATPAEEDVKCFVG